MTRSRPLPDADGQPDRGSLGYWPEIDGLRTIAVLSVFLFHLDRRLLAGGFVGVDVFFVVSGFLITSVLLDDIARGEPSVARFYQRRIARIAPAFFLVLVASLIAGALLYSAQDFASLGANSLSAALSLINMKLIVQGGYFQTASDANPLLHYWSLAVEEQYYLIFPFYVSFVIRHTRHAVGITAAIGVLSFLTCIVATRLSPTAAFYLLPTRAWELLAGSVLALTRRERALVSARHAPILAAAGLGLILAALLVLDDGDRFPGWLAALPVVGTVLALASFEAGRRQRVAAVLAHPILVFIGRRSYSLYLWHWPIFCFVDYRLFLAGGPLRLGLKIGLSVGLALLTYAAVERPLRTALNRRRMAAFGGFVALAAAVCGIGVVVRSTSYLSADPWQIAAGGITRNGGDHGTVALIGDSQGAMYGTELAALARRHGFRLNVLSMAAKNELPEEPDTYWPAVAQSLATLRPDVVVVAEAWSSKLGSDTEHLRQAVGLFRSLGSRVILMTQPPRLPAEATREAMRAGARPPFFEPPADRDDRQRATAAVDRLGDRFVSVIDVAPMLLNRDGSIKLIADNGRFTYHDSGHLTDTGTALVHAALEQELVRQIALR